MLVTGRLWLAEATECEQTRAASAAAGDGSAQQGHLRYAGSCFSDRPRRPASPGGPPPHAELGLMIRAAQPSASPPSPREAHAGRVRFDEGPTATTAPGAIRS